MARILCVGDLHCPVEHPRYLQFCKDLYKEFKCDRTVFLGDLVDWHAISMHPKEPECPGPLDEYEQAKAKIKLWHTAFPNAIVCIGNHDCRPQLLAKSSGIPERFLKDFNTLWETPTWTWDYNFMVDDVYYCHGTGTTGVHPAWNKCGKVLLSVCMGHCHSRAGLKWRVNRLRRIFAMDVGCGIDNDAFQFVYGRANDDKPILSAAVVLDGEPVHRMMPCGKGEKYYRGKFRRKQ